MGALVQGCIVLGTMILTAGTATPAALATMGTAQAMGCAAMASLNSMLTMSVLRNGFDPLDAIREVASPETLRNMGVAAASAGMANHLCKIWTLPKNATAFQTKLHRIGIESLSKTTADVAIGGKSLGKALVENTAHSAISVGSAHLAGRIGDMMNVGETSRFALHLGLGLGMGAGLGAITGQDMVKSAASGMMGAAAEGLARVLEHACADHLRGLSGTELDHARDIIAQVSKLGAGLASLGLGLNTEIALETADNAVTNNFMAHSLVTDQFLSDLKKAEASAKERTAFNGEDWDSLSIQEKYRRIQGHLGREDLVAMKELLRLAGDGARNHLFGGRGLDNLKNDVSYFCDLTSDRIQGWRDEGRRTGEFVSDALRGGSLARGCLGMVGDWGGLGAGAFLSLAGISRGGGTVGRAPKIASRVAGANGNRSGVANDNALRQTVKQQKVVGESPSASSSFQFVKGPGKPGQSSSRLTLKMSNGNAQGTGQTLKVQQGQVSGGGTSFNHVLTGKGAGNSLKIRRDQRGRVKGVTHVQDHHIISNKTPELRDHALWEKAGLHPNRTPNKMLLPTKEGAKLSTTNRSIHQGRHRKSVHERLLEKMNKQLDKGREGSWTQPQYQDALKNIIREERKALKSGDRILNKNHRLNAKDQD